MCRRIRPGQAGSSGDEQDFVNKVGEVECPGLGEDEYDAMAVPENWPTHLDEAIRYLNRRILPFLKFSPNELLLRLVLSTPSTPIYIARAAVTSEEVSCRRRTSVSSGLTGTRKLWEMLTVERGPSTRKLWLGRLARLSSEWVNLFKCTTSDLDYTFLAI